MLGSGIVASVSVGDPVAPSRIDRFVVLATLASGRSGRLLAAWDPQLERTIAIKLHDARDREAHARLLAEARAMARLDHPNVVRVHEVGQHDGEIFVAMELVRGGTLASWCAERPHHTTARFHALLELAIQAARGLAGAHAAGLALHELAPGDLLVDDTGRLRLAGFRRVRTTIDDASDPTLLASDLLALCATLWAAALGVPAPTDAPELPGDRRGVAPWFLDILRRGLAHDPSARWPSAAALVVALERGRARPRRRGLLAVLTGLSLLAITFVLLRPTERDPCIAADPPRTPWTASTRQSLQTSLDAERSPSAYARFVSVARRLDHFETRWREEYFAACESARERGVLPQQGPPLDADDPRLACLDEARSGFAVVLAQIGQLGARQLASATTLTLALPDPLRCRERVIAPQGEHARDVALRLAEAGTLVDLRKNSEAERIVAALAAEGWAGNAGLQSRGHLVSSSSAYHQGEHARAYDEGLRALTMAEHAGDTEAEAESWIAIAYAELARTRIAEAEFAVARAASVAEAHGIPLLVYAAVLIRGGIELERGDPAKAVETYRFAERIMLRHRGEHDVALAGLYADLVAALTYAGRLEEAVVTARASVAIFEDLLGPDSPRTARSIVVLGVALADLGEADEAIEVLARGQRLLAADPESSPHDVLVARLKRAEQLTHTQRYDEALAELAAMKRTTTAADATLAIEMTRAMTLLESGHADEAVPSYEALLAGFADVPGHFGRFNRAVLRVNLALALARAGRTDEAVAMIEPTLAAYRDGGMSDTRIGGAMVELAEVHRLARHPAEAIAMGERALQLLTGVEAAPRSRARAQLGLARAHLELGQRDAAREHARLAADGFRASHDTRAAADAEALAR